jgi:hypothetical protein
MYTQYLYHIPRPSPFLPIFPLPAGTNSPQAGPDHPHVLQFCIIKEKKQENNGFAYLR